jgi:hypothetical protein
MRTLESKSFYDWAYLRELFIDVLLWLNFLGGEVALIRMGACSAFSGAIHYKNSKLMSSLLPLCG